MSGENKALKQFELAEETDKQMKKSLTFIDITFLVLGALIGSGWLFASYYAAVDAGPGAILSWIIAGILMLFVALAFAELSGAIPKSGAIVRYPSYTHGSFASYFLSWAYLVASLSVAPAEAEAIVTYLGIFYPWLFKTETTALGTVAVLTTYGVLLAFVILTLLFLLNYYGINIMGKTNTALTYVKFIIPILTVLFLLGLFLHPKNYTTPSFMPYGSAPVIMSISTTGIVFSYLGFRQGLEFGSEAKNPQRDQPLGIILGFILGIIIYVLLQVAFIGAVPFSAFKLSIGNWSGLTTTNISSSPFYVIASLSKSSVLSYWKWGILLGAILAPLGTGLIYLGTVSRVMYGMASNGHIPAKFLELNKHKIPWLGLILSWILGIMYFLPFPSWAYIASLTVFATVFTYMIGGAAVPALRRTAPEIKRPFKLWAPYVMGLVAFVSAYLIVYWAGYSTMWIAVPLVLAGIPIYLMYDMPKRFGSSRAVGAIVSIIYWIVLILTTYFLIYKGIILPWALKGYGSSLPMNFGYNIDFWIFTLVNLVMLIASIYIMVSTSSNKDLAKKHAFSGLWVIAALFSGLILVFYGNLGPFAKPLLPYPYDNLSAIIVSIILFVFAERSAYRTEYLEELIKTMKGP